MRNENREFLEDEFGVRYIIINRRKYYATADLKAGKSIGSKAGSDRWQDSKYSIGIFQQQRAYIKAPVFGLVYKRLKLINKDEIRDILKAYIQEHGELKLSQDTVAWLKSIKITKLNFSARKHKDKKKLGKESAWRSYNRTKIKTLTNKISDRKVIV